jgi:hypothetical protein
MRLLMGSRIVHEVGGGDGDRDEIELEEQRWRDRKLRLGWWDKRGKPVVGDIAVGDAAGEGKEGMRYGIDFL